MSIYNFSYTQKILELLPPDKRGAAMVAWLYDLLAPVGHDYYDVFVDYKTGSNYDLWVAGSYPLKAKVQYGQSVYESIIDSNTLEPTNTAGWRLYQEYFIGVDERILYNHGKLILEYALNKRFSTSFRQPPLISDIYIETNEPPYSVFVVGQIEEESSISYYNTSTEYIINDYNFNTFYNFTVYVPLAVYDAVSADPAAREKIFRVFIDKYNTAGLLYNIVTY